MTYIVKEEFPTAFRRFFPGMEIEVDEIDSPLDPDHLVKIGKLEKKPEPKAVERVRHTAAETVAAHRARASDNKEEKSGE